MYHLGCKIPVAYLSHVSAVALAGMSQAQYQHQLLLTPVKKLYTLHKIFKHTLCYYVHGAESKSPPHL